MIPETYLNHPTLGLLYRICELDHGQEVFATLYAQRLFFLVVPEGHDIMFQSATRQEVRLLIEERLRNLRRSNQPEAFAKLQSTYQALF